MILKAAAAFLADLREDSAAKLICVRAKLAHDRAGVAVVVFKKRRRARYRVKRGHRQQYLEVIITEIAAGGKTAKCDDKAVSRARARVAALAEQKKDKPKPTRAQKIASGVEKPRSKKQVRRDAKTAAKAK